MQLPLLTRCDLPKILQVHLAEMRQ